jgi:hypothetical protein
MSPTQNGDPTVMKAQQSKIETIKNWSISTYKCTKQLMFEKLGKTSRTVDTGSEVYMSMGHETKPSYVAVSKCIDIFVHITITVTHNPDDIV